MSNNNQDLKKFVLNYKNNMLRNFLNSQQKQILDLKNNIQKLENIDKSKQAYIDALAANMRIRCDIADINIKNCELNTKISEFNLNMRMINASIIYFGSNYFGNKINIYTSKTLNRQPFSEQTISFMSFMSAIAYISYDHIKLIKIIRISIKK